MAAPNLLQYRLFVLILAALTVPLPAEPVKMINVLSGIAEGIVGAYTARTRSPQVSGVIQSRKTRHHEIGRGPQSSTNNCAKLGLLR